MADTETPGTEATEQKSESTKTEAPWGDDFDAERAWRLVQNLRSERDAIKAERDSLRTERDNLVTERDGLKEELQTKTSEIERISKENAREVALQKILRKHPELEDFADLLTGDTEEELSAKAERLAAIGKPKDGAGKQESSEDNGEQKGEQELPGMPKPDLKPGHGGEESAPFDPVAIAKAARR
jgi:hypothetical protein